MTTLLLIACRWCCRMTPPALKPFCIYCGHERDRLHCACPRCIATMAGLAPIQEAGAIRLLARDSRN